jgi:hypothetical protein
MSTQKIANLQGQDFNGRFGLLSSGSGSNDQIVAQTSNGIALKNKCEFNKSAVVQITSAQLLALNATPITVVAAPADSSYVHVVKYWQVWHGTGTAYTVSTTAKNLALKYTNASGAVAAAVIASTGLLDQATAQLRIANSLALNGTSATVVGDITPVAGAAIVANLLSGEITGGNYAINILVVYDTIPVDLTA